MALGFSMAFGAMFSKTWRVHKIFTNKKIQRMVKISYCLAMQRDILEIFRLNFFPFLYFYSHYHCQLYVLMSVAALPYFFPVIFDLVVSGFS